jgi:hypothetical protein
MVYVLRPRDNPEIAGVVFLEHGIHSANAASVAKHVLETYFAKKDGNPLPPPPTREDMPWTCGIHSRAAPARRSNN